MSSSHGIRKNKHPLGSPGNPIPLTTGIELSPGAKVSLRPDADFFVGDPVIINYSVQCLTITAPWTGIAAASKKIRISPRTALDSAFSRGWNKLPAELKLKIISGTVIRPWSFEALQHRSPRALKPLCGGVATRAFMELVLPWARRSPEMGQIAAQAFYEKNAFLIYGRRLLGGLPMSETLRGVQRKIEETYFPMKRPRAAVAKHIRHLVFILDLETYSFRLLGRIARGQLGFENLVYVHVVIDMSQYHPEIWGRPGFYNHLKYEGPASAVQKVTEGEKIVFAAKGKVLFRTMGDRTEEPWSYQDTRDELADLFRRSITFGGK